MTGEVQMITLIILWAVAMITIITMIARYELRKGGKF